MKKLYLITGANGHLGSAVCALLAERGARIRGLVLEGEDTRFLENLGVEVLRGDVRDLAGLEKLFSHGADEELYVIHAAGIVDINCKDSRLMSDVNINGAKNLISMCKVHPVKKFVYVSSVHAIPELPAGETISEVGREDFDPARVVGAYAKTKAAATRLVLESVREGVPAVVVHPSGIIGPFLGRGNHLVQLVKNYVDGGLTACVRGGYDFVDVRDCAFGCAEALERGRTGECYILSNRYFEIKDVLDMLRQIVGGKRVTVLPMWMAKMAIPMMTSLARRRHKKPIYTKYSLYTLKANGRFSHEKAERELGYTPRSLYDTLTDTVAWLIASGECREKPRRPASRGKAAKDHI